MCVLNDDKKEHLYILAGALRWTLIEAKYGFHCVSIDDKNEALERIIKMVLEALKETGQEQKRLT